jgi:hypothetical protein
MGGSKNGERVELRTIDVKIKALQILKFAALLFYRINLMAYSLFGTNSLFG